jgi:hypothetical protein
MSPTTSPWHYSGDSPRSVAVNRSLTPHQQLNYSTFARRGSLHALRTPARSLVAGAPASAS